MRLDNLSRENRDRLGAGDIHLLKGLLVEELDGVRDDLLELPLMYTEELKGRGKVLKTLIKLLSNSR